MNTLTEVAVSGYLLQHSLAGFPKFEKNKQTNKKEKKQKTAKTYTNTSNGTQNLVTFLVILQYLTDENNDMTPHI